MSRKNSYQRQMILDLLKAADHPTAQEVYEKIHKDYPRMSLGTVYRNLHQLSESRTVRRLSFPDSPDRFDIHTQPHQHFLCTRCGRYFNIDENSLGNIDDSVGQATGFSVEEHSMLFKGICAECREDTTNET